MKKTLIFAFTLLLFLDLAIANSAPCKDVEYMQKSIDFIKNNPEAVLSDVQKNRINEYNKQFLRNDYDAVISQFANQFCNLKTAQKWVDFGKDFKLNEPVHKDPQCKSVPHENGGLNIPALSPLSFMKETYMRLADRLRCQHYFHQLFPFTQKAAIPKFTITHDSSLGYVFTYPTNVEARTCDLSPGKITISDPGACMLFKEGLWDGKESFTIHSLDDVALELKAPAITNTDAIHDVLDLFPFKKDTDDDTNIK